MSFMDRHLPTLSDALVLPIVRGTADLTDFAYQGHDLEKLNHRIVAIPRRQSDRGSCDGAAIRRSDRLATDLPPFARPQPPGRSARAMPDVPRRRRHPYGAPIAPAGADGPRRPDGQHAARFPHRPSNVRLDLLYLLPDRPLPAVIPDHDVAFFAISEADPATLERLRRLFAAWPRPALNNPDFLPLLDRDALAGRLAGVPGICSPPTVAVDPRRARGAPSMPADQPMVSSRDLIPA